MLGRQLMMRAKIAFMAAVNLALDKTGMGADVAAMQAAASLRDFKLRGGMHPRNPMKNGNVYHIPLKEHAVTKDGVKLRKTEAVSGSKSYKADYLKGSMPGSVRRRLANEAT